jgi:hypothetical protein
MIKPSKGANRLLLKARKDGWLLAGHRARTLALADAIARVEENAADPSAVELATVPENSMQLALEIMRRGGLAEMLRLAPSPFLSSVEEYLSRACAPIKCEAVPRCKGQRAGRGAAPTCYPYQNDPRVTEGGQVGYLGAPTRITYQGAGGAGALEARYALVPLDSLITSHDPLANFDRTAGYPPHLQERDYANQIEREKVQHNANPAIFRPDLLISDNADALGGPPVINREGIVLAGNGRSMMLRLHVKKWGGQKYAAELDSRLACSTCYGLSGLPTAGKVLVRVVVGPYDPLRVSAQLNETMTAELSREVAAISAGQRLSGSTIDLLGMLLDSLEWSDAIATGGSRITAALRRDGLLTPANQADWLRSVHGETRDELNRAGSDRLRDAVIGATIRSVEALREASPALMQFFETVAPSMLKLDNWDRENKTGYNWIADLRACATEAIETATTTTAEALERYGGAMLPGMDVDPALASVLDGPPIRAALVIWLRENYPRRNDVKRALRQYWQEIPEQFKNPSGSLWELPPEDLIARKLDPEGMRTRIFGMATADEIRRAGGPRRAIAKAIQAEIERKAERKASKKAAAVAAVTASQSGHFSSSPNPGHAASSNPVDVLHGGRADNVPHSQIDPVALAKGTKHELEHTSDPQIAEEIAADHLVERADYYERLEEMERIPTPGPSSSSPMTTPAPVAPPAPAAAASSPTAPAAAAPGWTVNPRAAASFGSQAEQEIAIVLWAAGTKTDRAAVSAWTGLQQSDFDRIWVELRSAGLISQKGAKLTREGKKAWGAIAKRLGRNQILSLWMTTQARDQIPPRLLDALEFPTGRAAFAGPAEWLYRKGENEKPFKPEEIALLQSMGGKLKQEVYGPGLVDVVAFDGPIPVAGLPLRGLVLHNVDAIEAVANELARRIRLARGGAELALVADELGEHRTAQERADALFKKKRPEGVPEFIIWLRAYGVPGDSEKQARIVRSAVDRARGFAR